MVAAKAQVPAEVGMSLFAKIAAQAGLGRIDGDARARLQLPAVAVERIRAGLLDHAGKFVSKNEGRSHRGIADAGILVGMEIAAADACDLDAQKRLGLARRAWARHAFQAQVRRAVQASGQHRRLFHPPAMLGGLAHFDSTILISSSVRP
jgi:hypothetical protein